jgi:hypothetical protein
MVAAIARFCRREAKYMNAPITTSRGKKMTV